MAKKETSPAPVQAAQTPPPPPDEHGGLPVPPPPPETEPPAQSAERHEEPVHEPDAPTNPERSEPSQPSASSSPTSSKSSFAEAIQPPKRGPGRPSKAELAARAGGEPQVVQPPKTGKRFQSDERKAVCAKSGEVCAKMTLTMLSSLGPGFVLREDNEREKFASSFAVESTKAFFVDQDWADLPPTMGLIVAWSTVAVVLATKEENKGKVNALWEKAKAWGQGLKAKVAQAKA